MSTWDGQEECDDFIRRQIFQKGETCALNIVFGIYKDFEADTETYFNQCQLCRSGILNWNDPFL